MTAIAVGAFALLGALGMPIAFALGVGALLALLYGGIPVDVLVQRMLYAVDSFPLLAVPFFMIAGELMVKGGIMERLIELANSVVGRVQGGLAQVCMVSAAGLSAVSGAAVADATALGSTLVPPMRKAYGNGWASAVVAAAANLGPIIPPSAAMIVYAVMAGSLVSVGGLFMAGVVPGLIMMAAMMALCSIIARRRGYPMTGTEFSIRNVLRELRRSLIIFTMPVLVIGGIVTGAFTATESAAIAVIYALVIGFFITRKLKLSDLPGVLFQAALVTSILGALIAFASAVTFIFTVDLIPLRLTEFLQSVTQDRWVFLALVMLLLVVVGMFVEANAAYIMLVPLLAPIAMKYGLDPLHFGFLFVLNMVVGGLTPPVGILLFVMSGITKVPMGTLVRELLPFIAVQFATLALCAAFPSIVLWLPRALGLSGMSANPLRLCFVGDSYVAGTGDPACLGWTGRVAAAAWAAGHDISTYTLGIRGETGPMLRQRWRAEVEIRLPAASPGAVVFQFGINDISERIGVGLRATPEDSAAAARAIIDEARRRWPALWIGPPPANEAMSPMSPMPGVSYDFRNDRLLALNAAYAAIARDCGVPYLDIATPLSADAAYARAQVEGDGMHCSAEGYAQIAGMVEVWPAWQELLSAKRPVG